MLGFNQVPGILLLTSARSTSMSVEPKHKDTDDLIHFSVLTRLRCAQIPIKSL